MASDTKNVKLGVCQVFFDEVDLGYTKGGVEVTVSTETHKVEVDQFGKTPINETIMGRQVTVKVSLAETTLDNLVATMPGATLVTDGTKAVGSITIATQPTNGQTIVVNGKTITFKTAATGPLDVTIGGTVSATAANLAVVLQASDEGLIALANYEATGAVVDIVFDATGVAGNAFTVATGTAGASVTVAAATLTGGAASTSAAVEVETGIGIDLLAIARVLRLHPKGKAANDRSEDFTIPLAATAGALNFAYKLEDERIYNIEFMGYPDPVTEKLFVVGGPKA